MLRPSLSLAIVGTLGTAVMCGFAASWLFDLSTLEGMLLGAIISSTDGAAIFALLRGSTLRRKLARTLEGEAGFNDPVAVLLVIGFIEWIQQPDYGVLDMARPVRHGDGHRRRRRPGRRLARRARACGSRSSRAPGSTRSPRWPRRGLAFGGAVHAARLGLPRRLPRRADARLGAHPGQADRGRLPPGARVGRPDRDVPGARTARLPEPARRGLARGHGAGAGAGLRGAAALGGARDRLRSLHRRRAAGARLGRAARRGARSCLPPSRSSRACRKARAASSSTSSSSPW